ncbi:glycosyltransferase [Methylosinus sp. Sm6]|uniref:glycosyltransferase n=1 Tax=Methylosinus sp. Sm6 TaxID=2866948 RepID=UPI001C98E9F4|nr:glycosyltransferase [Methylosinus sp. Sm6]MBY6243128.1 glycosyltransferase [Methylosinus sp. Sm6]
MRICHVIESASGGSAQVVVDLLRAGIAAGDEQTLIYSPVRAEARFLQAIDALRGLVRVHALEMQRRVGWRDIIAAGRLMRLIRALGPFDIVASHSSKAGALARMAGIFLPGVAQVYTPHAFITMAPESPAIYGLVEWAASWFCDAIIVGSQQEWDHARRCLRILASRLRLVPMGVDLSAHAERDPARRALLAEEGAFIVGFVGRLVSQKNPERLAEVFAHVAAAEPRARFVVVGDGPLHDKLRREIASRGVADRTRLVGGCDARALMPGFDCLVCTSDYESYGLIFPEALAAGVPIVSPPVGVAREAASEGETGVVTGFDASDIAAGVLTLAALGAEARARLAERCREHSRRFDFSETARRTRALYASLLRRAR